MDNNPQLVVEAAANVTKDGMKAIREVTDMKHKPKNFIEEESYSKWSKAMSKGIDMKNSSIKIGGEIPDVELGDDSLAAGKKISLKSGTSRSNTYNNSGDGVMAHQTLLFEGSGSNPTSPHHVYLKEVTAKQASMLNEKWHSRLPKIHWSNIVRNTHYVCYGLFFVGNVIGVAIWSSPVAQNRFDDGKTMLELRRLALSDRCPKNTASRVISLMVRMVKRKFPELTRLISYQDTDVHTGTIYMASNWTIGNRTKFISWTTDKRKRNNDQSDAEKIRWEWSYEKKV